MSLETDRLIVSTLEAQDKLNVATSVALESLSALVKQRDDELAEVRDSIVDLSHRVAELKTIVELGVPGAAVALAPLRPAS